ncbi:hypothetical protein Dda_3535 [Drechslerella dactyloides]|uniref:Uncharacterized protein n=1 Tax=Drechslerella dactyloides TaxID=74499 RepID=A0AAD6NJN5_DREDA|nr:hypothetical protein Dda_3535 [Drechslerella dactyloides]
MGAVVSCIGDALRAIGRAIMAVISAIGRAITAVVNGIVDFLMIIVSCLTCNRVRHQHIGYAKQYTTVNYYHRSITRKPQMRMTSKLLTGNPLRGFLISPNTRAPDLMQGRMRTAVLQNMGSIRRFSHGPTRQRALVSTVIVAELRKANVRCTKSGINALNIAYAGMSSKKAFVHPLDFLQHLDLVTKGPLTINVPKPDAIWYNNLNTRGVRQWRCYDIFKACINCKVYRLWEALYAHSPAFRYLIKQEEAEVQSPPPHYYPLTSSFLWEWMTEMIEEGFVERDDIDALPEPLLQDAVLRSRGADTAAELEEFEEDLELD